MAKKLIMGLAVVMATRVPEPLCAGALVALQYDVLLDPAEVDVGDIIEVGMIPAGVKIIDATVVVPAEVGGSASIGTLSGEYMAKDNARVLNENLYVELAMAKGVHRLTDPAAFDVARHDAHTGIGLEVTEAFTAAGKIGLTVIVAG